MCYTKVVTKEKGNCSVTDKRYNIYKEDIKMAVVKLTTDNFEQEVLQAQQPVLVDFYADWCGPCKMQSPIIEEAAEAMGDRVKFGKVNVDEEAALALKYQIMSIPTLVVMKDGIFKGKAIGLQNMEAINQLVADAIKE